MENKSLSGGTALFRINKQLLKVDAPPFTNIFLTSVSPIKGQDHKFDIICKRWFIIYN